MRACIFHLCCCCFGRTGGKHVNLAHRLDRGASGCVLVTLAGFTQLTEGEGEESAGAGAGAGAGTSECESSGVVDNGDGDNDEDGDGDVGGGGNAAAKGGSDAGSSAAAAAVVAVASPADGTCVDDGGVVPQHETGIPSASTPRETSCT